VAVATVRSGLSRVAQVYAWGMSNFGQLGNGETSNEPVQFPTEISLPEASGATAVACGLYHSLLLIGGKIYVTGSNKHGQHANGSKTPHTNVFQVISSDKFGGHSISKIFARGHGCAAVSSQKHVYSWGMHSSIFSGFRFDNN